MEENVVLSGDNAFNAHFGECIAAIGDIDDDGFQGRSRLFPHAEVDVLQLAATSDTFTT